MKIQIDEKWINEKGFYVCPFCNKEYGKNGIATHIWRNHGEGIEFKTKGNKGYTGKLAWNKGLTKDTDERVKRITEKVKEGYSSGRLVSPFKGKHHSQETKDKFSLMAKKNNLGGVRQSKRIDYNGKQLGSTYELEVVKSLDKNNIKWDICKKFNYIDPFGKVRSYTPDIYLIDYDIYLDPKNNFLIHNINPSLGFTDLEKIKRVSDQNNIKVIILNEDELDWEIIRNKIAPLS